MPLFLILQTFAREIIINAPEFAKAAKREYEVLTDPYVSKSLYWFGRGGAAERDAVDHRAYDRLDGVQREALERYQADGKSGWYNSTKPQHRRPWTGVAEFLLIPDQTALPPEQKAAESTTVPGSTFDRVPLLAPHATAMRSDDASAVVHGQELMDCGAHEEAIKVLLAAARQQATREDARAAIVELMNLLGPDHEVVQRYRPQIAAVLF